jgi:hypothetical protein
MSEPILREPVSYRCNRIGRLTRSRRIFLRLQERVGFPLMDRQLQPAIFIHRRLAREGARARAMGAMMALCLMAAPTFAAASGSNAKRAGMETTADALPSAPQPQTLGTIHGTVTNHAGAPEGGIQVVLTGGNLAASQSNITSRNGKFSFGDLAAGTYSVSATGPGFEPVSPTQVTLGTGEAFRLPITIVQMPKVVTTVHVTASTVRIATAQVKQETQQRAFAVIPNFSTSYIWDAAPLTAKLKFRLEFRTLIDPFTIGSDAVIASVEQWHNTFPGYGGGWPGYGKRFGATLADSFDARIVGDALLPSLLHQDPRYFYHGGPNLSRRITYALQETLMCRGDNQRQQFCYSRVLGDFAAAGIANLYHAPGDRGVGITFRDTFIVLGGDAIGNEVREFLSKAVTAHKPAGADGKPQAQ